MVSAPNSAVQRRRITVQGIVQGVGFRPFVYGQAHRRSLAGFVLNDSAGVTIEIEGPTQALDDFERAVREELPPLAHIDTIATECISPCHESTFVIAHSQTNAERHALISPDTATCHDCLHECFDPDDRRYHYPFINCTNCGPRFSIVQDVPYDREKTTMSIFSMCAACQAEYSDPLDRRFHAQPNACPVCGPSVQLFMLDGDEQIRWNGHRPGTVEPIAKAAQTLAGGAILAIKGLGGYHLACDALNTEAVQRLRQRKRREAKPFALMTADLETIRHFCYINDAEVALLQSHRRSIVLLTKRPDHSVAPEIAPDYTTLGFMLPYTPLHHLLLHHFAQALALAPRQPAILVMTSGNLSEEPIAYRDDDAGERLSVIAEAMLTHNRDIHIRCDDTVMRIVVGGEQFFRRSRGYAPEPIPLTHHLKVPILACGGHLKNTFCLGKGRQAFISHHIGDLENLETLTSFREGIEHFQRIFAIAPEVVAYDLHPEYLATKYALVSDIPQKIGVQHHHAHIASVLAEYGLTEPVIGIAADGTGYGTDGTIWGGEILIANLVDFERRTYLRPVPLPGGEQAIRQPWRMAAVYLTQAFGDTWDQDLDIPFVRQPDHSRWNILAQMITRGINSPLTSSLGRLFDAVTALIGLRNNVLYEGQAAIELEALASTVQTIRIQKCYPFEIINGQMNVAPLIRAIVDDLQQGMALPQIAWNFHRSIAELLATACLTIREQSGLQVVALSGGVFQNRLLLEQLIARLREMAFRVYINRRVPPNDGGISFGQIAVAAARLQKG